MDPRNEIIVFLHEKTQLPAQEIEKLLQKPKEASMGDISFPCFVLAKAMKKAPQQIAQELAATFHKGKNISAVQALAGYLNFTLNTSFAAESVLQTIHAQKDSLGKGNEAKKVMIEFPSPNTNKPLHLGHVKLIIYGMALTNILRHRGNTVITANLLNDRGVHICKSMLAYQKWGKGETPQSSGLKGDYLVGKYYVMFATKSAEAGEDNTLEDQAQEMLQRWEEGDKEVITLWKQMNAWAKEGMDITFERLSYFPDKEYYESAIYQDGKKLVLEGYEQGILKKDDDGNIYADLEDYGLNQKVLLRADGTAIYSTQDIALAYHKHKDFAFDRSFYIIGTEQNFYLKQVFKTMEVLGFEWGKYCEHIKSGMISLPTGKMKSREGTVVEADGLIEELVGYARDEIKKRYADLSEKEVQERSLKIGLGAMRFFFLKYDVERDFVFDPKESVSFEGETGPYVQYAHARICSMLRKFGKSLPSEVEYGKLSHASENELLRVLQDFSSTVEKTALHLKPHILVHYLLELTRTFNTFYHNCPCLNEEDETTRLARLSLCDATRIVIALGLKLLQIQAPEEM